MNQRELLLILIIVVGILFTASSLTREKCFDCTQPLFSKSSSCSINGGSCINGQTKAGFTGLWDYFTGFQLTEDEDSYTLSCSPNCYIKFDKKKENKKDSVSHSHNGTHQ